MGCCCAKDAVVVEPEPDAPPDESQKSDTVEAPTPTKKKKKPKKKKDSNFGWSRSQAEKSVPPPPPPPTDPQTPPGAIPIKKGEKPPPGWGGTPEVEDEIEVELDERKKGPRALTNIPGGNGYISGTRKDQEISEGVMDRIKALDDAGLQTTKKLGRKMLTPRIITDVKETWDVDGNITRYMTHYIEEPDGRKHTEKETVYIAAGDPDPLNPEAE